MAAFFGKPDKAAFVHTLFINSPFSAANLLFPTRFSGAFFRGPLLYNNTSATKCQVFCAKNIKTDLSAIAVQVCSDLFRSLFHLILPSFYLFSQFISYCKDHNVLIPAFRSPPVFFIVYQYTTIPSKRPPLSGRIMLVFILISPPFSDFSYAYQLMLTSIDGIFLHLL